MCTIADHIAEKKVYYRKILGETDREKFLISKLINASSLLSRILQERGIIPNQNLELSGLSLYDRIAAEMVAETTALIEIFDKISIPAA